MNRKIHIIDKGRHICFLTEEQLYSRIIHCSDPTKRELEEYAGVMDFLQSFGNEDELQADIGVLAAERNFCAARINAVACIITALNKLGISGELTAITRLHAIYTMNIYNKAAEIRIRRGIEELGEMKRFKEAYEKWAFELACEKCSCDEMLWEVYGALPSKKYTAKWAREKESFRDAFFFLKKIARDCSDETLKDMVFGYFDGIDGMEDIL